ALALDAIESGASARRNRRELRIVLDVGERWLAAEPDFHPGIQNPEWIERILHRAESLEHFIRPDGRHERRAQTSVAMFTRHRSPQPRGQLGHGIENLFDARSPVWITHVDEWVHVDVRIAGMAKDHASRLVRGKNLSNTADVCGKLGGWDRAVFDEL